MISDSGRLRCVVYVCVRACLTSLFRDACTICGSIVMFDAFAAGIGAIGAGGRLAEAYRFGELRDVNRTGSMRRR